MYIGNLRAWQSSECEFGYQELEIGAGVKLYRLQTLLSLEQDAAHPGSLAMAERSEPQEAAQEQHGHILMSSQCVSARFRAFGFVCPKHVCHCPTNISDMHIQLSGQTSRTICSDMALLHRAWMTNGPLILW
eukprot:SAG31_NODE_1324_length_8789_cov_2.736249_4_plen_132_part_00